MSASPSSLQPRGDELRGAVAVVTGGGRGIGRAIVLRYARAGAKVAFCARTQAELDETLAAVEQAFRDAGSPAGPELLALRCDVTSPSEVASFGAAVRSRCGAATVLVNNAGTVARGRLDEQPADEWRRVVEVSLHGTHLVTREFLPAMRAARSGRIINISSISGRMGTASLSAYCAAKHGVIGLTRALAEELRGESIQVNAICPGSVDTRMLEGSGYAPMMSADDVAGVACYLAASAPSALTGACLDVFG